MVITAFRTLTYGVSLRRYAAIPFRTGGAANVISDRRNSGETLMMETNSKAVGWT
jgi:hypothetical protein